MPVGPCAKALRRAVQLSLVVLLPGGRGGAVRAATAAPVPRVAACGKKCGSLSPEGNACSTGSLEKNWEREKEADLQ